MKKEKKKFETAGEYVEKNVWVKQSTIRKIIYDLEYLSTQFINKDDKSAMQKIGYVKIDRMSRVIQKDIYKYLDVEFMDNIYMRCRNKGLINESLEIVRLELNKLLKQLEDTKFILKLLESE